MEFAVGKDPGDALEELCDGEVFGSDVGEGVERAAKDVVPPLVFAGGLDDFDVFGFFDDADGGGVAVGVGADAADVVAGDVSADAAECDAVADGGERCPESVDVVGVGVEQVERYALGAFGADSG